MDLRRLRRSRCHSALPPKQSAQPKGQPGADRRPQSSQLVGTCGNVLQASTSPLPVIQRGRVPDYINHTNSRIEYLTIGTAIAPSPSDRPSPRPSTKGETKTYNGPNKRPVTASLSAYPNKRPLTSINGRRRSSTDLEESGLARSNQDSALPLGIDIQLRLETLDLGGDTARAGSRRDSVQKAYTAVLRDRAMVVERLTDKLDEEDLDIAGISVGHLVLHLKPRSHGSLEALRNLQQSGKLTRHLHDSVVSEDLLREVGLDGLGVQARLDRINFQLGQNDPGARVAPNPTNIHRRPSQTDGDGISQSIFVSRSQCVDKIHAVQLALTDGVDHIRQNYADFSRHLDKFLMVLRLTKPVYIEKFTRLDHVLMCLEFLSNSESVKKNVRTELVKDFLGIVNSLRVKVVEIKTNLWKIRGHLTKYVESSIVEKTFDVCQRLEEQYDSNFDFSDVGDNSEAEGLNALDRHLFRELVSYVPWLLEQISLLGGALENIRKRLTFDEAEGEDVINVQFRRVGQRNGTSK